MPYNKKPAARRNYRTYRKRRSFTRAVSRAITRVSETKYNSRYLVNDFNAISTSWTEYGMTSIGQGDDIFFNREGRKIEIIGFYLTGVIQGAQSNIATDDKVNTVRIVLSLCDVNTPMSTAAMTINDIIIPKTVATMTKKITDKVITLQSPSRDSTGYMPAIKKVKIYHKFKYPIQITYGSNTSTSWNKTLVLSMISDSALAPSPGFTQGTFVMMYKDV